MRDLRSYVTRDLAAVRASKDAFWVQRISERGPGEGLRIADELRRQVLLQKPGWPDAEQRRQDFQSHVRLSELLHRAGRARRR
jgi:hypothetical protein